MRLLGVSVRSCPLGMFRALHAYLPKKAHTWIRHRYVSRPEKESPPTHGDSSQLAKLREGKDVWNGWRKDNPNISPNLAGFNLRQINLFEFNLQNTNLQEANLRGSDLRADLRGANLIRSDLRAANLHGAFLESLETDVRGADLRGAILKDALMDGADIRYARGIRLDSTRIWQTRFSPTANDPWSKLRKGYTGPRLFLNFLILVVFLAPYAFKAVTWLGVNRTEIALDTTMAYLAAEADQTANSDSRIHELRRLVAAEIASHIPSESNGWRRFSLWEVLVGFDRDIGYWLPAILLVTYNLMRGLLTALVAPLRDEEERSGHAPPWSIELASDKPAKSRLDDFLRHPILWIGHMRTAYGWMMWPDRVVRILFPLAMASFAFHMWVWLGVDLLLPPP